MCEWPTVALEEIAAPDKNAVAIGPFGSRMKKDLYVETGVPVIRGTNLIGSREFQGNFVYVSKSTADELCRANVFEGDLVFPHRGAIGEVGIVTKPDQRYMLSTSLMKFSCDRERAEPLFLYYFFRSAKGRFELLKNASQVGTPGIARPLESLRAVQLELPPLFEQQRIAHILGTLDDKIELNRRMNQTLEEIARAIFKSWFIDFDPVIDNAILNGKPIPDEFAERAEIRREILARSNGSEGAVDYHRLFSDSFQDSSLGKIPKGWEVKPLSEICVDVVRGVTPKYEDGSGRFIINQRVNRGFTLDLSSLKELSGGLPVPGEKMAKAFDVLVNSLGEGTIGRIHFFRGAPDVYAIDQHMTICRCLHPGTSSFVYQYLASPEGQYRLQALKSGSTTMTMLNVSKLRAFEIAMPGRALLDTYWQAVSPLWSAIASSERQGVSLSACRDALLP